MGKESGAGHGLGAWVLVLIVLLAGYVGGCNGNPVASETPSQSEEARAVARLEGKIRELEEALETAKAQLEDGRLQLEEAMFSLHRQEEIIESYERLVFDKLLTTEEFLQLAREAWIFSVTVDGSEITGDRVVRVPGPSISVTLWAECLYVLRGQPHTLLWEAGLFGLHEKVRIGGEIEEDQYSAGLMGSGCPSCHGAFIEFKDVAPGTVLELEISPDLIEGLGWDTKKLLLEVTGP